MIAIALMVFGAMFILTGIVMFILVSIEFAKERDWLKSRKSGKKK